MTRRKPAAASSDARNSLPEPGGYEYRGTDRDVTEPSPGQVAAGRRIADAGRAARTAGRERRLARYMALRDAGASMADAAEAAGVKPKTAKQAYEPRWLARRGDGGAP